MANAVRVRVEMKDQNRHPSYEDFRRLHAAFNKARDAAKIKRCCEEHEAYESKSRKKRRKKREAENALLKNKLKENFSPRERYD